MRLSRKFKTPSYMVPYMEHVQRLDGGPILVGISASASLALAIWGFPDQFLVIFKVVTGLFDSSIAPGLLVVHAIYRFKNTISPLLRWVLILLLSASFEVVLGTAMSILGIPVNYQDTIISQSSLLIFGSLILTVTGIGNSIRREGNVPIFKTFNWFHALIGLAVGTVIIASFVPRISQASPAIYLSDTSGQLTLSHSSANESKFVLIHITNPTSHTLDFRLLAYVDGKELGAPFNQRVRAEGSWIIKYPLPSGFTGAPDLHRLSFQLTQPKNPRFKRTVWFYIS